jgi:hypothetical protein
MIICVEHFLESEIFHTKLAEKIKTHILGSINFFFEKKPAVCADMRKNTVDPSRPEMAI